MFLKVIIPSLNIEYLSYKTDEKVEIGNVVSVPYRHKEKIGLVVETSQAADIEEVKIKYINNIKDFSLSANLIDFVKKSAKYYIAPVSKFFKLAIPNENLFKGLIQDLKPVTKSYDDYPVTLSEAQQKAYEEIYDFGNGFNAIVLEGVTGSGKTEIYLKLIHNLLKNTNKQILIMLPEIALTSQLESQIKQRLGLKIPLWHSDTSSAQKKKIYQAIISGKERLIVGARSALYLPYKDLGMIVIDEEHDSSYKQEEQVIYNARDMAVLRGYIEKFPVILSSATPSLETINNIDNLSYKHVLLPEKFANKIRPEFKIVDLKLYKMQANTWISSVLLTEIKECLAAGNQALLFLNRRGYAPLNVCSACGYRLSCPNCSCWLVAHKELGRYICHHCGYEKRMINKCSSCEAENTLRAVGPGVERIYEEVKILMPEARPVILSRDQLSNLEKSREILDRILKKEYNILIGTQAVAKGFHFPDLTLVGVIDNDIAFAGGDLRAHEKAFQLLEQVAGRSAREKPGKVVIQTYDPGHILVQSVINDNKNAFLAIEKANRKHFSMPPFGKLISLVFKSTNEKKLADFVQDFARKAPRSKHCLILGPTPASLVKLNKQFRYKLLLKISKKFDAAAYIAQWMSDTKIPSYIQMKIDVDPYSFL